MAQGKKEEIQQLKAQERFKEALHDGQEEEAQWERELQ